MISVWKFTLRGEANEKVEIPCIHKILCTQMQYGKVCVWAMVDTDSPAQLKEFAIVPTGGDAPWWGEYVGTVQFAGMVWHVFTDKLTGVQK